MRTISLGISANPYTEQLQENLNCLEQIQSGKLLGKYKPVPIAQLPLLSCAIDMLTQLCTDPRNPRPTQLHLDLIHQPNSAETVLDGLCKTHFSGDIASHEASVTETHEPKDHPLGSFLCKAAVVNERQLKGLKLENIFLGWTMEAQGATAHCQMGFFRILEHITPIPDFTYQCYGLAQKTGACESKLGTLQTYCYTQISATLRPELQPRATRLQIAALTAEGFSWYFGENWDLINQRFTGLGEQQVYRLSKHQQSSIHLSSCFGTWGVGPDDKWGLTGQGSIISYNPQGKIIKEQGGMWHDLHGSELCPEWSSSVYAYDNSGNIKQKFSSACRNSSHGKSKFIKSFSVEYYNESGIIFRRFSGILCDGSGDLFCPTGPGLVENYNALGFSVGRHACIFKKRDDGNWAITQVEPKGQATPQDIKGVA